MDKSAIARVLEEMGDILELSEANPFQIQAYRNGAQNLLDWEGDLAAAVQEKSLTEIPGIGKGLSAVISDLVTTGRSEEHEALKARFPDGLLDLLSVPRLGPKRIRQLHVELGVDGLDSLERAVHEKRLRSLRGFGAKSEERLIRGIDRARRYPKRA